MKKSRAHVPVRGREDVRSAEPHPKGAYFSEIPERFRFATYKAARAKLEKDAVGGVSSFVAVVEEPEGVRYVPVVVLWPTEHSWAVRFAEKDVWFIRVSQDMPSGV